MTTTNNVARYGEIAVVNNVKFLRGHAVIGLCFYEEKFDESIIHQSAL